jgi:hypothetical protein
MSDDTKILGFFFNENACAIATDCMNREYPNVCFEGVEYGDGRYKVTVRSMWGKTIHNSEMVTFQSVFWVLYKYVPVIQTITRESDK